MRRLLYSPPRAGTSSFAIECVCGQTYNLTLIGDRDYWRNNIVPSDGVLEQTRRMLHDDTITFDTIIDSMIGIAKFENGIVHVCFIICNMRGFFDCIEDYPIITLITVWRTNQ